MPPMAHVEDAFMMRRLLLPLADDSTSEAAASVAVDLARLHHASISSLAVVDSTPLLATAAAPGFAAAHLAYSTVVELEETLRERAADRLRTFRRHAEESKVQCVDHVRDGTPWRSLTDESMLHDLLVIGRDAHFVLGGPDERGPGETLRKVLDHAVCPVLCVSESPLGTQRVVAALDGRGAAERTLRDFVQTGLLADAELLLAFFGEGGNERDVLEPAQAYLATHDRRATLIRREGRCPEQFPSLVQEVDADLALVGAHGKGRLSGWLLGSTTRELLERSDIPVFVSH